MTDEDEEAWVYLPPWIAMGRNHYYDCLPEGPFIRPFLRAIATTGDCDEHTFFGLMGAVGESAE